MVRKSVILTGLLLPLAVSMAALAQYQPTQPQVGGPSDHMYIYPKNGQPQQQQWSDRYACHGWAKSQSGFDPTKAAAGTADDNAVRRDQYRRAMTACLEARGYSVQFGAPPPAAAPPPGAPPLPPPPPVLSLQPRGALPASEGPGFKYHPVMVQIEGGYSVPSGTTDQFLDGGSNVGLGLTWFPSPVLPVGFRLDGSYSSFKESTQSLNQAASATGSSVSFGRAHLYGGDLDLEIDLPMGPSVKEYLFGGAGRYREQTTFKQVSYESGVACGYFYCYDAYFPFGSTVEQGTTGWLNSWNAGMGFEFALADPARLFIEARFLRIGPASNRSDFIPIRVGLRF